MTSCQNMMGPIVHHVQAGERMRNSWNHSIDSNQILLDDKDQDGIYRGLRCCAPGQSLGCLIIFTLLLRHFYIGRWAWITYCVSPSVLLSHFLFWTQMRAAKPSLTRPFLCCWRRLANTIEWADNFRSEVWCSRQISWRSNSPFRRHC